MSIVDLQIVLKTPSKHNVKSSFEDPIKRHQMNHIETCPAASL